METNTLWDVVVVGGGPAGMMAAGTAAENGSRVLLIEKNDSLGKKLLITGGGRCNVTNSEFDTRKLLSKFKDNDKFLFSAFSQYGVKETLDFFHSKGMDTKVENELRTFPVSNSAQSVWDVLVDNMKEFKVKVFSNSPVTGIVKEGEKIIGVQLKNKEIIKGKNIIIATGGTSRPETGSTGDGYKWLKNVGHTVSDPVASLVPVAIKDDWVKDLAGITLPEVKISVLQNDVLQEKVKGKILFTHFGISGPTVLNLSKSIGELLKYGPVTISLDLMPSFGHDSLNTLLQNLFKEKANSKFKNSLSDILPSAVAKTVIELSKINEDIKCNSITREERLSLIQLLKAVPMRVDKLLGLDKAIISSGGVSLTEVDFKTMASRIYPNLYLIGDILNIDRPSGGYSLQLCWTTGFVAGKSASLNK
jgi:predicted Rossmann fold flavoprotein